ncbi:MAG: Protein involved in catabolism of external [Alphaproteobacteria bacterium]|nr:Protein involved in catabolism of external [Alphaproteobacteria bacterium]
MLSYQHIYHAGNIVDCQKHALLAALLSRLNEDAASYCYIDTHSGRGLYDLQSSEAEKLKEYETGIARIWKLNNWPVEIQPYKKILSELNPDKKCRYYPGSPYVAQSLLRPQDKLELYEIHPQELLALQDQMGNFKNVEIYNLNGWEVLEEYLPPEQKRGLVLVDPSYEVKDEYRLMPQQVQAGIRQWPEGMYMIWYPILKAARHIELLDHFRTSGIPNILQTEIHVDNDKGLQGTGILIINPPTGFENIVTKISVWLTQAIGKSTETRWLVE